MTEARELSRLRDIAKLTKLPGATKTSRGIWKYSAEIREPVYQSIDRIKSSKPPHNSPDGSAIAKFSNQEGEETNEIQKNETKTNTPKEGEQYSSDNRETQEHIESDKLLRLVPFNILTDVKYISAHTFKYLTKMLRP
jgi:hypothetical protein